MKLNVYSVYDKAVNAFLQPFYARTAGEAIRSFTELSNDQQTNVGRHPTDYLLFFLAEYDDNNGRFTSNEPMRLLGANEVLEMNKYEPLNGPTGGSLEGSKKISINGEGKVLK